jgi:hypothetical protein
VSAQPFGLWFQGQQSCEPDESTKCRPSSLPLVMVLPVLGLLLLSTFREASLGAVGRGSTFLVAFFFASLALLPSLGARGRERDAEGDRLLFGCGNLDDEVPARV